MRLLTPYWPQRRAANTDILNEMERMFDGFGRGTFDTKEAKSFLPACEISESESQYLMSVDLPGVKKDEIKIEVADNTLTISGERKAEKKEGDERNAQYIEKIYGKFTRTFTLPNTADADKIEATYEDGVLNLAIPKATTARTRKIEVQ